jgi:hypothetical protein
MKPKKLFTTLAVSLFLLLTPGVALATGNCLGNGIEIGIPIVSISGGIETQPASKSADHKAHICVANDASSGGAIIVYIKAFLQYLSGLIGLVIVLLIVISGIEYITAYGDPGRIKSAKTRLTNALIGLFLFIFAFAILSFIIPGGIIG